MSGSDEIRPDPFLPQGHDGAAQVETCRHLVRAMAYALILFPVVFTSMLSWTT